MSKIIKNMKITHSIPFLYIFRIDKIFFHSYIDTYYENQNTSYSKWADYFRARCLDSFINNLFLQKSNTFNFKFEKTLIIAFIIKFLFEYSFHITINLNKYLNNYNIFHRKIIDFISKKWNDEEFRIFRYIFTTDEKKQIGKVMHYIIELSLSFIEKSTQTNFCEKFQRTLVYNKIGNEIKECLKKYHIIIFSFLEKLILKY